MRALLFILTLAFGSLAAAEDVRLTNGEWTPYLGASLPHQGVASRIVAEAFALEGVTVHWEFHPWARSLRLAEKGERHGTAIWLRNADRERDFYVSDPVIESGYVLFHRKDTPLDWQSVDDLRHYRLGATIGYDYGEAFQRAEQDGRLRVQRLAAEEQGLRMLLAGRIDVFPMDKVVGIANLQGFSREERSRVTFHPQPLRSDTLHLLLSRSVPGNEQLMARFNQGLAQLRESGKIARYLLEAEEPLSSLQ
ncbi:MULTISPECIES: substrate-binding periplasmic protein [Pseudomonadaceae]|uniref:substrate-binding periplasmic protein n=1 Tax=Pseudomonadaceae TaxID=135621 RepID=UPI00084ADD49|nr:MULTISPECIES: transporter substrate-binding domain-containing protein [Pseudomonas]OEC59724.1 amino acid ABC transporter substrate-binding protein [Pseudomonas sp. ENNP23]